MPFLFLRYLSDTYAKLCLLRSSSIADNAFRAGVGLNGGHLSSNSTVSSSEAVEYGSRFESFETPFIAMSCVCHSRLGLRH